MTVMLIRKTFYDTAMTPVKMSGKRFMQLLKNPPVYPNKDYAPLGLFGVPVRVPMPTKEGCDDIHYCSDNLEYITCLQIDYDDGTSFDDFKAEYDGKYKFIMYTSYRHGLFKEDRFRVILPLSEKLYTKDMGGFFRDAMTSVWHCDPSCFDKAHMQVLPCIREPGATYRYHVSESGEFYSIPWDIVNSVKDKHEAVALFSRALLNWYTESDIMLGIDRDEESEERRIAGGITWAQTRLYEMFEGNRNNTMFDTARWLCNHNIPYDRVLDLVVPQSVSDEWENMISRIYKIK